MGGVLHPRERCTKTGDRVLEVLRTKHLEARTPTVASLNHYKGRPLELTPVDTTKETETAVAGRLSGAPDRGGKTQCHYNNGSLGSAPQVRS